MAIEFEIFQHEPDTTETPTVRWMQAADALTVSPFREFMAWPDEDPQRAYSFRYSFTERNPLLSAKDFFSRHGGSAKAFLLPSWERDWTPAEIPAAGAVEIEVEGTDWLDTYPIHHPDGPGRYAFIFDTTHGFHAFRITAAVPEGPGTTMLSIEQALPFTPTAEALYGWLYVARFAGDDAEWQHYAPHRATIQIGFITTRQRIVKDENGNADGATIYASQPIMEVDALQGEPDFARFDVAYQWGPVNLRITQSATFATRWAAWIASDGVRLLKNATDGDIFPPDTSQGFLCDLFTAAPATDRISLAFDQTGYEVIGWQHDATNIKVRKKTGAVITTYTFAGKDPVLFFNGIVAIADRLDGDSDVVCYYRKPGESVIFARYQRDNFGIEYKAAGVPFLPILLLFADHNEADRTFSVHYIDNGWRQCSAVCNAYPEPPEIPPDPYVSLEIFEAVEAAASLLDCQDEYAIIEPPAILESAAAEAMISDFESENVAPPPTDFSEPTSAAASLGDIAYEVVIVSSAPPQEEAGALASLPDMTYILTAIESAAQQEAAAAAASIPEIYFGP